MSMALKYLLLLLIPLYTCLISKNTITNTMIKNTTDTNSDSMVLQYLVRESKVKPQKRKAIILLHGVGINEQDLFSFDNQLPDNFIVISLLVNLL